VHNLSASATITATDNWWGHTSGPGGVGPGSGDEISGTVAFTPWLSEPVWVVALPTDDPLIAARGTTVANTIHIQNWIVPTDTVSVTVSDTRGWLVTSGTFTVSLEEGVGASVPVSLTVPSGATLGDGDDVTVAVVSNGDPTATGVATFRMQVSAVSDVAITQESIPNSVLAGERATYTLAISNHGPDAASEVTVSDTLPSGILFDSVAATQGSCAEQDGSVICNLGTLTTTGRTTVTVSVTSTAAGALKNIARVAGNEYDPYLLNNEEWASTLVNLADLSLTKWAPTEPVPVGAPLTYTLVVVNDGPSRATGVTISDTLPVSTTFATATITTGDCQELNGAVTCTLNELVSGETATATLVVIPTAAGTITNTAHVAGNEPDYPVANLAMAVTTIAGGEEWVTGTLYLPLVVRN
jgi:uncharacterized repeat protein (TIGR01451 family)